MEDDEHKKRLKEYLANMGDMTEEERAEAEIRLVLEAKLGKGFDQSLVEKIRKTQTGLRAQAGSLKEKLLQGGPAALVSALRDIEQTVRKTLVYELGAETFAKLDKTKPDEKVTIFDTRAIDQKKKEDEKD